MFGQTDGATIKNLSVKKANIIGQAQVGSLIGHGNSTTVTNCHVYDCNVEDNANDKNNINKDPLVTGGTTAEYKHRKDPVLVEKGDIVTYTLRIYNEGQREYGEGGLGDREG